MFSRILIANRGEIAVRIIHSCKRLGVEAVAIYSQADADSLHVRLADAAICIGPPEVARSYLHIPSIISAAEISNVEAIHPGYGFLAENAHFADICRSIGIEFIGPLSEAMDKMANKAMARKLVADAGVPVLPGSDGPVEDDDEARSVAHRIGYPVMIKACAGGGGRGIRIARNDVSLRSGLAQCRSEAEIGFGDSSIYLEKFLEHPRHVEVQVLADNYGAVIHLGERDCSIQRRHQKLVEESPSPILDNRTRRLLCEAGVAVAKACGYTNAGTVEFLYQDGQFYFMELNARVQVEHPVTEMVTGVDIIEEQLHIASGEPLRYKQKEIKPRGHSIECRINAEDPDNGFAPSPGKINLFIEPIGEGLRVDSHAYSGYRVPPNYDSLIGKLIVHGKDRTQCIERMRRAISEMVVDGVRTTLPFHRELMNNHKYINSDYDLNFLAEMLAT
ncbi:MAG: acetyl-CoA carboxylase biotin carboxylase subunit [Planctomycetes bacterium]|nr:acetyl-CoA carboxylase biotin carboxylase subunit [Planctomycetota bacterium]